MRQLMRMPYSGGEFEQNLELALRKGIVQGLIGRLVERLHERRTRLLADEPPARQDGVHGPRESSGA
jgi:hypothetical protein